MKAVRILAVLALVAGVSNIATAQTATQIVTIQVSAINVISVAGAPSLSITTATAGSAPTAVSDASSSWNVTTNQSGAKITASINSAMPAGLTLSANLSAPAGGTSAGLTALSTTAADVVTGITKVANGPLGLTYQLDATVAAGVVASTTRTVTYTITGGT
jgi:hypothetical protein